VAVFRASGAKDNFRYVNSEKGLPSPQEMVVQTKWATRLGFAERWKSRSPHGSREHLPLHGRISALKHLEIRIFGLEYALERMEWRKTKKA